MLDNGLIFVAFRFAVPVFLLSNFPAKLRNIAVGSNHCSLAQLAAINGSMVELIH